MRTHLIAAVLSAAAPAALAQEVIAPPVRPAPTAVAPIDDRAEWCEEYARWLVAMTPSTTPLPADVRPTQRLEVEFNSCKLDPQEYERDTRAEADRAVEIASG